MTNDEIRELIQLVMDTGVAELEVQRGDARVRIRRAVAAAHEIAIPAVSGVSPAPVSGGSGVAPTPPAASPAAAAPGANEVIVKSQIVGTYYDSPKPGDLAFVKVGDSV